MGDIGSVTTRSTRAEAHTQGFVIELNCFRLRIFIFFNFGLRWRRGERDDNLNDSATAWSSQNLDFLMFVKASVACVVTHEE